MLFNLSLAATRRVFLPGIISRTLLTRSISSTPVFDASKKAGSTTAGASKTKASGQKKASDKPKASSKAKGTKKKVVKPKEPKEPEFSKEDLKIPARPYHSPYLMFVTAELKGRKLENGVCEPAKEVAARWKTMSEDEKKPYLEQSHEVKTKTSETWNTWLENVEPRVLREINKRRRAAGKPRIRAPANRPKGPTPSFMRFSTEWRAQNPSQSALEGSRNAAAVWRDLPLERKKVYQDAYAAERAAFVAQKGSST